MAKIIKEDILKKEIRGWQGDIHDNEYDADKFDFVFERIYEIIDELAEDAEEKDECVKKQDVGGKKPINEVVYHLMSQDKKAGNTTD